MGDVKLGGFVLRRLRGDLLFGDGFIHRGKLFVAQTDLIRRGFFLHGCLFGDGFFRGDFRFRGNVFRGCFLSGGLFYGSGLGLFRFFGKRLFTRQCRRDPRFFLRARLFDRLVALFEQGVAQGATDLRCVQIHDYDLFTLWTFASSGSHIHSSREKSAKPRLRYI